MKKKIDKHPIVQFLKEFLDYGVTYGVVSFLKLFTLPNKFKLTFENIIEK